jgi:adenylate cyclase
MQPRTRQRASGIWLQMAGWTGAALMFYLIRFQGLESVAGIRFLALPEIDHAYLVRNVLAAGAVSFGFNFLKQVSRKFGPGNLRRLLLGKYYHPRRENRIFLFLDLKSSTTHAERLGHERYSSLIQDCFRDLAVTLEHDAGVYQYVGDEAVLSWEAETGLDQLNCLRAFFRFRDELQTRAHHYERRYGFVPVFKAGGNIGEVTGVEVGEIKREIAFHGDVLNTAARIQALCNEHGEELLISEYLQRALPPSSDFTFEVLGAMPLRGRQNPVEVYAVRSVARLVVADAQESVISNQ